MVAEYNPNKTAEYDVNEKVKVSTKVPPIKYNTNLILTCTLVSLNRKEHQASFVNNTTSKYPYTPSNLTLNFNKTEFNKLAAWTIVHDEVKIRIRIKDPKRGTSTDTVHHSETHIKFVSSYLDEDITYDYTITNAWFYESFVTTLFDDIKKQKTFLPYSFKKQGVEGNHTYIVIRRDQLMYAMERNLVDKDYVLTRNQTIAADMIHGTFRKYTASFNKMTKGTFLACDLQQKCKILNQRLAKKVFAYMTDDGLFVFKNLTASDSTERMRIRDLQSRHVFENIKPDHGAFSIGSYALPAWYAIIEVEDGNLAKPKTVKEYLPFASDDLLRRYMKKHYGATVAPYEEIKF